MQPIYLDNAATTSVDLKVMEAMQPYFSEKYGNPSSIHAFGREAKAAIETSREQLAALLNCKPEELVFTASGTEADNFAIIGIAEANQKHGNHIITSNIEHHAVLEPLAYLEKKGFIITRLSADKFGMVDPDDVKKALTDKTILVSIMHANNEIGTIQPIQEISEIIRRPQKKIYFHTDAVQTVGQIKIDVNQLGVDLLSLSGHKFHGPKGIGALMVRKGTRIVPFLRGGGQERGRRASTENVASIVGIGVAAKIALLQMTDNQSHLKRLQEKMEKGIIDRIPEVMLNGHPEKRLAKVTNFSVKYIEGESMLLNLDLEGIAASTGSACSSGTLDPSHVLLGIGLSHELAHGSIRFSYSKYNTGAEIDKVLDVFPKIVEKLRKMSPLYKG